MKGQALFHSKINVFFPKTSTKLGTIKHLLVKEIQICSNRGPCSFSKGDGSNFKPASVYIHSFAQTICLLGNVAEVRAMQPVGLTCFIKDYRLAPYIIVISFYNQSSKFVKILLVLNENNIKNQQNFKSVCTCKVLPVLLNFYLNYGKLQGKIRNIIMRRIFQNGH